MGTELSGPSQPGLADEEGLRGHTTTPSVQTMEFVFLQQMTFLVLF